jgi:hypothetical protein
MARIGISTKRALREAWREEMFRRRALRRRQLSVKLPYKADHVTEEELKEGLRQLSAKPA